MQRLASTKRVRIREPVEIAALAKTLASNAWKLTAGGQLACRVIAFVDSRKMAQEVCAAIENFAKSDSTSPKVEIHKPVLFVGGRRVAEREAAAEQLRNLGLIAGSQCEPDQPVFVVATSAGEVGIDIDADHAVLDLVEWERMVQRLGRVNRRGVGDANVWVVAQVRDDKTTTALAKEEKLLSKQSKNADAPDEGEGQTADKGDDTRDDKPPKKLNDDERRRVER